MKIMILANFDLGLYQFRKELIRELLKENEVIISLPYGELVEPLKEMGCRFIDTPVDRRGINPVTDLKLFRTYIQLLKKEKPDLVIAYTIKPDVYGGIACRLLRIPYVVNITGLGTAFQSKGLLRTLVTVMYKTALRKARTVYFENAGNRQIFIDEKIANPEQTCLLMGAGVNLERFPVSDYPTTDGTKFLFMGRVMQEKGIDELFESMHRLYEEDKTVSLDVLGFYEEDYKEKIDRYTAEGWLHFHGFQTDVRPFIEACHCFVLPSWHEGMANTNLESAATGRPVITSNIHGCMEAVADKESGFLAERRNADSLYHAMKAFTALTFDERKTMGLAGRERMEALFDKKVVVRNTIDRLF